MRATDFVDSYIDAWNHCDAEGVAEHLVKNGMYCDIPQHQQFARDELVANLDDFFASEKHLYELAGEVLSSDSSIAFQYKMSSANPKSRDWWGAEFITFNGNGALRITDYYDPAQSVSSLVTAINGITTPKYAKSGLNKQQIKSYKHQLVELMDKQKIYLDPDITLPKLAVMVDCSVNHLSQAVNSGFDMSFFDFVNSYRIQEAKSILLSRHVMAQSILDVSLAVGFNSNSAFYAAFKKTTGQTPAQFRRASDSLVK
ncbi:MAG TPA: AraC family transcriptional regulator [Porticoccaceae bacterium]|nr:AraC family transcriptional regulator [Porticoccaceae bacterium]HIK79432.1 AraC family transcriptional regulator [Porticoccaceae bacterium]